MLSGRFRDLRFYCYRIGRLFSNRGDGVPDPHPAGLTLSEYFEPHGPPPEDIRENALHLLAKVNALLNEIPLPEAESPSINSGWRPAYYNRTVSNAAPNSHHITGRAVDVRDDDGMIDDYLFDNQDLLTRHGLFMEHPAATKRWCHLQDVPPRSQKRVFFP